MAHLILINSFYEFSLATYYSPGTHLSIGDITVNRTDTNLFPVELIQADKHISIYSACTCNVLHIQLAGTITQGIADGGCCGTVLYKVAREDLTAEGEGINLAKVLRKHVPGSGHSKCKS